MSDENSGLEVGQSGRVASNCALPTNVAQKTSDTFSSCKKNIEAIKIFKRPIAIWVILIWYLFISLSTPLSLLAIYAGLLPISPNKIAYLNSLSWVDHVFSTVIVALNVSGAITLFMLKKISAYLLSAALAISIITTLPQAFLNASLGKILGAGSLIGFFVGYAICLVVCVYAFRLKNRGFLS